MKTKMVGLLIAMLFMASVMAVASVPAAKAHTESEPFTTDLIADGGSAATAVDVGDVLVWNDEDYLYVKYVTTDTGWWITEVHLEVATSLAGIPQAKGNPIPGKFKYGEQGLWTMEYSFPPIPLTWPKGTTLYIAAHAKVWEAASLTTITVVSEPGVTVYGPSSSYLPLGDSGWGSAGSAVATWVHPYWSQYVSIPGATWISTAYQVVDPVSDSWRWFHDEFVVPGYPAGGTVVLATSDNAEEVYFNGAFIGSDGEVQGPFQDNWEWSTVSSYAIDPQMGTNTLDFIVRNYAQSGGTVYTNPTGLIYKASVSYYARCETAWGAGPVFPGKNWATYFTYTVQGWTLIDEFTVPATTSIPTTSNVVLEAGRTYKIEASGTYYFRTYNDPKGYLADAEWALRNDAYGTGWVKGDGHPYSSPYNGLDLCFDAGTNTDWGDFSVDHVYSISYTGTGSKISLFIKDDAYSDNSGSLTVRIYEWA